MVASTTRLSKYWEGCKGNFAMQIGVMGDFCSDVCYKMPVNVCEIILWLWRGEVSITSRLYGWKWYSLG